MIKNTTIKENVRSGMDVFISKNMNPDYFIHPHESCSSHRRDIDPNVRYFPITLIGEIATKIDMTDLSIDYMEDTMATRLFKVERRRKRFLGCKKAKEKVSDIMKEQEMFIEFKILISENNVILRIDDTFVKGLYHTLYLSIRHTSRKMTKEEILNAMKFIREILFTFDDHLSDEVNVVTGRLLNEMTAIKSCIQYCGETHYPYYDIISSSFINDHSEYEIEDLDELFNIDNNKHNILSTIEEVQK